MEKIGPTLQTITIPKCDGCVLLNRKNVTSADGRVTITHYFCKHGKFLQYPQYHEKGKFIGEHSITPSFCPVKYETWG